MCIRIGQQRNSGMHNGPFGRFIMNSLVESVNQIRRGILTVNGCYHNWDVEITRQLLATICKEEKSKIHCAVPGSGRLALEQL